MVRSFACLPLLIWLLIALFACDEVEREKRMQPEMPASIDSNQVVLEFSFEINRTIYRQTNFGEPPQLAIWIESPDGEVIRTVWVTHRAGHNQWRGKVECPVALPYWESRIGSASASNDKLSAQENPLDAVSGATPVSGRFSATVSVPAGSYWNYFIEVNVSADYNEAFPYWSPDGLPDSQANGQPSLVYGGRIIARPGGQDAPLLIGRSEQRRAVDSLSHDLSAITSAKNLLGNIRVRSGDSLYDKTDRDLETK